MGDAMRANAFVTEVSPARAPAPPAPAPAVSHSRQPTSLQIDSSSCNIQDGAAHLTEMLSENTVLRRWDLGNNRLGDRGTAALARGLAVNTGLRNLNLAHNRVAHAAAGKFSGPCTFLRAPYALAFWTTFPAQRHWLKL